MRRQQKSPFRLLPLGISPLFLGLLAAAHAADKLPLAILVLYLSSSIGTFAAYWIDKTAACNQRRRTPEIRLHLLALAGGWPGALLAQQLLRHKCSKPSFLLVFWAGVILNCSALLLYAFPAASAYLLSLLNGSA
jgi:uncharacterized membrane protein YsdA (DUF1294 family)